MESGSCIAYTARISCVDYATHGACSASNDLLSFPHINNSRPRHGESSKGPKTTPPPTLPTTQAGPDATHGEPAYHLPILRLDALQISPELRFMSHPTISRHHPYVLVLTSRMDAHSGRPYLAVLGTALCPITRHRAGQYCTTEIRTVSRHLCLITTNRAKIKKIAKCHIIYTPNYPLLPYLSASFTSALTLHIDTN